MNKIKNCPVCNSEVTNEFLNRKSIPVLQNTLLPTKESAQNIPKGDLDLKFCENCGFIFNSSFDSSKLSYDKNYENTQSCSPLFDKYMDDLVSYLVDVKEIKHSKIVEVGCGKGGFLKKLIQFESSGNIGYGFDPSYIGPLDDLDGKLHFQQEFFGPECSIDKTDVIICRHVIEHISNPLEFLMTIRDSLKNSPNVKLFFETPCVEWIFRNRTFWDFFYEHCSYFTKESLTNVFNLAGFQVEDVKHTFGDQYLWLEASIRDSHQEIIITSPSVRLLEDYCRYEDVAIGKWMEETIRLSSNGRVAIWGAGAKGVTFANLIDPMAERINCVVDINPKKQGKYLPGTGHEIVNPLALETKGINSVILMNPNYSREINSILIDLGLKISVIEV